MGTNYKALIDPCGECGRPRDRLHIGKSSMGWAFLFRAYRKPYDDYAISSVKQWKEFLSQENVTIEDEYSRPLTQKEFWALVKYKNENEHPDTKAMESVDDFRDEGCRFTWSEFS